MEAHILNIVGLFVLTFSLGVATLVAAAYSVKNTGKILLAACTLVSSIIFVFKGFSYFGLYFVGGILLLSIITAIIMYLLSKKGFLITVLVAGFCFTRAINYNLQNFLQDYCVGMTQGIKQNDE